ncbi:MAG TPA: hypothetical protein VH437_16820 [Terriglobales bacterium]|jgi:hypothetical protein
MVQLTGETSVRLRILISVLIGAASGVFCWYILRHLRLGAADFTWTLRAARFLLERQSPYDTPLQQYPMTAAPFGIPFLWLPPEIAAGAFYGLSSALLAYGLSAHGYYRLFVFLAYPYWAGILTAQWAPLIMAAAFFPLLLPATLAKPQVGLPVTLTRLTRKGIVACVVLIAATLLLLPRWPLLWIGQFGHYEHFFPILALPGPLLALALFRYRERDAQFLLLSSIMPQRWFFDSFTLWLIPESRREILFTAALSWLPGIWRWYHMPGSYLEVGRWTVIFFYLPMLIVVMARAQLLRKKWSGDSRAESTSS